MQNAYCVPDMEIELRILYPPIEAHKNHLTRHPGPHFTREN